MLFIYLAHGNYFLASLSSVKQALLPFLLENKVLSWLYSYKSKHIPTPITGASFFEMTSLLFALPCTLLPTSHFPSQCFLFSKIIYLLTYFKKDLTFLIYICGYVHHIDAGV